MKLFKFFTSSLLATAIDFLLYALLITVILPVTAHLISASVGMVVNFLLQYRWVFAPTRGAVVAFLFSLFFSLGGILLGAVMIFVLTNWTHLREFPMLAKMLTIGLVFFYNYTTKKIALGDR